MKKVILLILFMSLSALGWAQTITVAVDNFTSRSGYTVNQLSDITELFAGYLHEYGKVRVLTRSQWDAILKERNFQQGGLVDPKEIRRVGVALGAQAVVTGTMMKLDSLNVLNLSILDIETGEMLAPARRQYERIEQFMDLLPALASDLAKQLKKTPALIGQWKVDGKPIIITFNENGTFSIQNCDFGDNFKLVKTITNNGVTGYKFEYIHYKGNVKGTYTYTEKEISISGNFSGTIRKTEIWNDLSGHVYIGKEEDKTTSYTVSFNYKLNDNNRLELINCIFLRYSPSFSDNRVVGRYDKNLTRTQ